MTSTVTPILVTRDLDPLHAFYAGLVYATVASRTANALLDVNAVIEVGVVRKVVHANPLEWLAGAETRAHRLQIRTLGPDLLVTTHTRRRGRQTG
jgi:hypothetical protein